MLQKRQNGAQICVFCAEAAHERVSGADVLLRPWDEILLLEERDGLLARLAIEQPRCCIFGGLLLPNRPVERETRRRQAGQLLKERSTQGLRLGLRRTQRRPKAACTKPAPGCCAVCGRSCRPCLPLFLALRPLGLGPPCLWRSGGAQWERDGLRGGRRHTGSAWGAGERA